IYDDNKKLKCIKPSNEIELGGTRDKRYAEVSCYPGGKWSADSVTVLPSHESITVTCQIKECDKSLMQGFNPSQMTYDNNTLKCNDESEEIVLQYTDNESNKPVRERFTSVSCVPGGKWSGTNRKAKETLGANCKIKNCHVSLIGGFTTSKMTYENNQLKCKSENYDM
ncbi:hypothetical protein PFISCL1PPCAC_24974, partial [Pristionchus fissidentatus]